MKGKGGGFGGMQQLMKQANQMQNKMKKIQEELATQEFEGTSGGGAVNIKVNGNNQLLAVTIQPDVMEAGDVEMLQDLILTATNEALKVAKETSRQRDEQSHWRNGHALLIDMILHVPSLEKLVHELNKLPGIGPKTAQRLAYYILRSKDEYVDQLGEALQEVKARVHECPICFSYTEEDGPCHYCRDATRSDEVLCVVEGPSDIARIDNSGAFRGRYHVLHGAISPLDGVSPNDLKIPDLLNRINDSFTETKTPIREVILALDADLEGDTTVLYLAKVLSERDVKVTRIAHGVPIGGDIDYIDYRTLGRALENRVQI